MQITATARFIRVSPRKLELLLKSIRGLRPKEAMKRLEFLNKSGALPLKKLIESALANARNKEMDSIDRLDFAQIQVLPAGSLGRFRAVARGMAHEYKRRMSHVRVILEEKTDKTKPKGVGENENSPAKQDPASQDKSQAPKIK